MDAEFITQPDNYGRNRLDSCAAIIRKANDRFGGEFQGWVSVVGGELRTAQSLLSVDGDNRSEFRRWVKSEFNWTRQRAHQLMDAEEIMGRLSTTVDRQTLPTSERQCRELLKLPDGDQQAVWQEVCDAKDENGDPLTITAKLIRETAVPYLSEEQENSFSATRNSHPKTVGRFAPTALGWSGRPS